MSADNGVFIAHFPDGTMRVAHSFMSCIDELETHWYSPEEYQEAVKALFSGPVFVDEGAALLEARRIEKKVPYTEYGITTVFMSVNYGEKKVRG